MARTLTYAQAINEALHQKLVADERIIIIGQGVKSPWYVGATCTGLVNRFGENRVIDTPVSENGITGVAVGAALAGLRPVLVFPRMDFMYYAFDQIINHAANWNYMFGGRMNVPLTIWGIVNRGGEQAAQHSQAIQAMFCHVPGLKVVAPSNAYDAKGLLIGAIDDDNPVIFVDDRWLYDEVGEVPEEMYGVPIGRGVVRREGKDVTLAANSYLVREALRAADILDTQGIRAEVLDLRSLKPLDKDLLTRSVRKTGRCVAIDGGWRTCGLGAEISAIVTEGAFHQLKCPVARVSLPDAPAPASRVLEASYYPMAETIIRAVKQILEES